MVAEEVVCLPTTRLGRHPQEIEPKFLTFAMEGYMVEVMRLDTSF